MTVEGIFHDAVGHGLSEGVFPHLISSTRPRSP
jgi:hypothetical protein